MEPHCATEAWIVAGDASIPAVAMSATAASGAQPRLDPSVASRFGTIVADWRASCFKMEEKEPHVHFLTTHIHVFSSSLMQIVMADRCAGHVSCE